MEDRFFNHFVTVHQIAGFFGRVEGRFVDLVQQTGGLHFIVILEGKGLFFLYFEFVARYWLIVGCAEAGCGVEIGGAFGVIDSDAVFLYFFPGEGDLVDGEDPVDFHELFDDFQHSDETAFLVVGVLFHFPEEQFGQVIDKAVVFHD